MFLIKWLISVESDVSDVLDGWVILVCKMFVIWWKVMMKVKDGWMNGWLVVSRMIQTVDTVD